MLWLVRTGKSMALATATTLDVFFELAAELVDPCFDRPSGTIGKPTDGRARNRTNRVSDLEQQVDIAEFATAIADPLEDFGRPSGPFAARRALTAGFVGKESASVVKDVDHARVVIDDDDRSGPEP